jgi:hypothetical protein
LSYNSLHFCQRFASATLFPGQKFVLSTWTHSLSLFPVRRVGPGGPPIIWNAMPIRSFKSLESTFRQCLPQKDEKLCTYLKWHFSQCFPSMRWFWKQLPKPSPAFLEKIFAWHFQISNCCA